MTDEKRVALMTQTEASRCLLCYDAPCTAACKKGCDPAAFVRSIRFENPQGAAQICNVKSCSDCSAECESACIHYEKPIAIHSMACSFEKPEALPKTDLSIEFCGVKCINPFFLSSSIVAGSYEMCARALKAGWAGIVYKTIGFLIPDEVSPRFDAIGKENTPFIGFRNLEQISDHPLEENLDALKRLKQDFPDRVIVASIMGQNEDEWEKLSELVTEAGVDIIECNFSCPHMKGHGLGSDVGVDPELVASYTAAVRRKTDKPVLAKMTPNITHIEIPAIAAMKAGATGIAGINTIKSITGIDYGCMAPSPHINGKTAVSGYSGKAVKPIALRMMHELTSCGELSGVPVSGMGGIETWRDALDFIALGCTNIQITTSVMQYGYRIIDDLISGMKHYLASCGMSSISQAVGIASGSIVGADSLDRKSVEYPKFNLKDCIGCGRCKISCDDAGHQAITIGENRMPRLSASKCVGCQLCRLVCPTGAILQAKRIPK